MTFLFQTARINLEKNKYVIKILLYISLCLTIDPTNTYTYFEVER